MTASEYILDLYKPEDRIAIVLISRTDEGRVKQRIMNAGDAASEKFQAWFRHMNARERDPGKDAGGRPFDVYTSMNTLHPHATGRTKNDIAEVKHVFMDIDQNGKQVVERVMGSADMPKPNYILESSPDKYQMIFKVQDFTPERAETLSRNMVQQFGADPARIDVSSVLRLPGFRNQKPEYAHQPHYVKVERIRDGTSTPRGFPERFMERGKEYEITKPIERSRGSQRSVGEDQSRKDFGYACSALRRGRDPGEIASEIDRYRQGEKHRDYGQRTVSAAQRAVERDRVSR